MMYYTNLFAVVVFWFVAIGSPSNLVNSLGDASKFQMECLAKHNKLRALHGVPPLKLSTEITKFAQEWANNLAASNIFQHRPQNKYGENLYMSYGAKVIGATAVQAWYDEIKDYNFDSPGFSSATGHFTQVVWKDSKYLGCAYKTSSKGYTFVVANYDPPGNFMGRFPANVLPPQQK